MNLRLRRCRTGAFSLVELTVLVVLGGLLVAVTLPQFARTKHGGRSRIVCVNNLKQVGIAFRTYAVDNDGAYPWQVTLPVTNGTRVPRPKVPYTQSTSSDLLGLYLAVSNELSTPKIVACPEDSRPALATNTWAYAAAHPRNGHRRLSYFVGLDSSEEKPESILAGDRNLTNDPTLGPSWQDVVETTPAWVPAKDTKAILELGFDARTIHKGAGNLLLGDGSVQQVVSKRLPVWVQRSSKVSTTAWLLPVDH